MESLCYRIDYTTTEGDSPAALGNRIAAAAISYGRNDGAHEALRYLNPDYKPVNAPLVVEEPGTEMRDPNRWQPLALAKIVAQNGIPVPGKVQTFIGSHWGTCRVCAAQILRGAPPPGSCPATRDPSSDADFQGDGGRSHPLQQRSRPGRQAPLSTSVRPLSWQHTGDERPAQAHDVNPATGRKGPYAPTSFLAATSSVSWPSSGPRPSRRPRPATGKRSRTKSLTPPGSSSGSEPGPGGRPARVGREALLRAQRAVHDAAVAAWGAPATTTRRGPSR